MQMRDGDGGEAVDAERVPTAGVDVAAETRSGQRWK
jgi:hypothetical protein